MAESVMQGRPERQKAEAERIDRAKASGRKALSAQGVHDALLLEGREEVSRPWNALAWSGLAAGASMGLSLMAEAGLRTHLPDREWMPLVSKLGYSVGFLAVMLGRQQLYTETTLTAFLPFAHDRTAKALALTMKLWVVLLLANLVGAYAFAAAAAHTSTFTAEMHESFRRIGEEAARHGFGTAFVKGIFGGWLIALMVWLMPSAESARVWIIIIITWLLAVTGLTHIIAGSIEVFYLVTTDTMSFGTYLMRYGLPVFLGNSIGGVVFVAALNRAQVITGKAEH